MNDELLIRYVEAKNNDISLDLGQLGESLSGFNSMLLELCEISNFQGEIEIKTVDIRKSSIDVSNIIYTTFTGYPFNDVESLLNFLRIASPEMYQQATQFFSTVGETRSSLNGYFREYAFDAIVISNLLSWFAPKLLSYVPYFKKSTIVIPEELNQEQTRKLIGMVNKGRFKRALVPLTQGGFSSIEVHAGKGGFKHIVNEQLLEAYLPEEEVILSDLENGSIHKLAGEILALQSTRGDTIKIRIDNLDPRHSLLVLHPPDGMNTRDYINYYQKRVGLEVEVYRKSMYKKPELILREIWELQEELFSPED